MERADLPADRHCAAREEVSTWRGSCLDFYSRGERAIGQCLLAMQSDSGIGNSIKLHHLAGQRTAALLGVLDNLGLTDKASKAAKAAIEQWLPLDSQRAFLAHGVVRITLDPKGQWFAIFDMVVFRGNAASPQRWAVSAPEAKDHCDRLEAAWKCLSAQLGQVRKTISG